MIQEETIREVIISQRKFIDISDGGTPREVKATIHESFALVITGVRRCGKSTFLSQLLAKQKVGYYLNLEDPRLEGFEFSDFNKVENMMVQLYGEHGTYFFDEVQNIDKWEKFIRYLVDKKQRIVITGSNAQLLSTELGTKLTGRHLQTEMFPFSFYEFTKFKKQSPSLEQFEDYMVNGGFPEYIKQRYPAILHELLYDIVAKDIAVRFAIRNTGILNKLLIYLVSNVGKEFSYNSLKSTFSIRSVQSVIDYTSYFENAYLIFTLPRFSYSYRKQQANPKKIYSIDNGFSSCNSVSFSKDNEKMLENVVFLGIRRKFKEIFYFKEGGECDFLIKQNDKITHAIQVCFNLNENNKQREIQGVVAALTKCKLGIGFILTYNQEDNFKINSKEIKVMPAWKWLLSNEL